MPLYLRESWRYFPSSLFPSGRCRLHYRRLFVLCRWCPWLEWGAVSISVWLLLGALGVPILTMGKAGVGIFLSPVGGYYIGFILMAGFSGIYLKEKAAFSPREYLRFWGSSFAMRWGQFGS